VHYILASPGAIFLLARERRAAIQSEQESRQSTSIRQLSPQLLLESGVE
jgi:hypothetical protein